MANQRISKAAGSSAEPQVHRLTDMLVDEVSMVDRAANQRKYLMVKRDQKGSTKMGKGAEVTPNGAGGFTAGSGVDKGGAPPPGGPDKKPKPGAPGALGKAAMDVPPGFKQVAGPLLGKVSERLTALGDAVDGATEAEVGDDGSLPGVPAEFSSELSSIMGLLDKLGSMFPGAPADPEDAADGGIDEAAEGEPPVGAGNVQMSMKAVAKFLGVDEKVFVAKVGAKMSKERLTQLQQAVSVLSGLVNQLQSPPAGAAPGMVGATKTAKSDGAAVERIDATLAKMLEGFTKLAATVTKQGQTLERITKSRAGGNSLSVEEGGGSSRGEEATVSWPLDMNRAVTRESVGKSESFFDD